MAPTNVRTSCTQLLKEKAPWTVDHVYCLLPTLHDIGATPNGQRLTVCVTRTSAHACPAANPNTVL